MAYAWAVSRPRPDVVNIVPWVASIGLHAAIVAIGFFLTWTVINLTDQSDPIVVEAEFQALNYDPLVSLEADLSTLDPLAPRQAPDESFDKRLSELLADLDIPVSALDTAPVAPPSAAEFMPAAAPDSATFVGLTTTNARRIVYVIDASGSMIRSLPIVIEELARSLSTLSDQQRFGLVFFQHNRSLVVPPASRLVAATPQARMAALNWIDDHVIPAGRSNPLAAIEKALGFDPDVIFLLSENITGSGEFEIDQRDLLDLLDKLNPTIDDAGHRATQINCVQFLDPDPLETLRKIAERHGGPNGYKFLGRAELGLP